MMIPFDEAVRITLDHVPRLEATRVPLHAALGLVLAEPIASDVDMPPFDKSAMDGFAVVASDLASVPRALRVTQEIAAGVVPKAPVRPGQCARIMTGAPVPQGAEAVVMVEHTRPGPADDEVTILQATERGRNICRQAEDVAAGDVVLRAGHAVRPPEIATLAACGRAEVSVYRAPRVAVLSTGDEVVPIERVPEAGQIRDANSHYVAARLARLGIGATLLGIAPDEPQQLKAALASGMEHDVLAVSGGVSMGVYDLVPGLLRELGCELFFEKVAMQPGKPTVFGRRGPTVVLGLPGNPVSVLVATELFLVPAIKRMMGYREVNPPRRRATLTGRTTHRPGRVAHKPGVLAEGEGDGGATVEPLRYHGSAHIHALSRSNCLIVLPADEPALEPAAMVEVVELRV